MKERDILLTGDKWTIVIEIGIDDYRSLVQGMMTACNNLYVEIGMVSNRNAIGFSYMMIELNRFERVSKRN